MYTHTMLGSNDVARSKAFYDATLGALGIAPGFDAGTRVFYRGEGGALGVGKPADGNPATPANGGTTSFAAPGKEAVDAFYTAGLANGGTCEGEPGRRANAPARPMAPICAILTATRSAPFANSTIDASSRGHA